MKLIILFILLSFTVQAQVFKKGDSAILVMPILKDSDKAIPTTGEEMSLFIPAESVRLTDINNILFDTVPILPLPKYKTTLSKDKIVSVTLLMTKVDGSIIVVDSAWRMGIRKDIDKISIIYPDSTRTVYRITERDVKDTLLTIPFTISKKIFDEMQSIKLEIIR